MALATGRSPKPNLSSSALLKINFPLLAVQEIRQDNLNTYLLYRQPRPYPVMSAGEEVIISTIVSHLHIEWEALGPSFHCGQVLVILVHARCHGLLRRCLRSEHAASAQVKIWPIGLGEPGMQAFQLSAKMQFVWHRQIGGHCSTKLCHH